MAPGLIDKDGPRESAEAGRGAAGRARDKEVFLAATAESEGPLRVTGLCALRGHFVRSLCHTVRGEAGERRGPGGKKGLARRGLGAEVGAASPSRGRCCRFGAVLPGWRRCAAGPQPGSASAASPRCPLRTAQYCPASPPR